MNKNENPFLDPKFIEQIDNYLPEDHPAREDEKLTQLQKLALPFALWLFDTHSYLGQGRTELMAHVVIKLCIKYGRIQVEDPSTYLVHSSQFSPARHHFLDRVLKLTHLHYSKYRFQYNRTHNELILKGVKE
jgi:hypothetical protein